MASVGGGTVIPSSATSCCHERLPLRSKAFLVSPSSSFSPIRTHNLGAKRVSAVAPVAVLPLFSLAADPEVQGAYIRVVNTWMPDDITIKNIYLAYCLFFCWGCCVFCAMKDPFYDSDFYRGAGGDGSGNWLYRLEEEEEVEAREELRREELVREIEERVGQMREIEQADKEKELV